MPDDGDVEIIVWFEHFDLVIAETRGFQSSVLERSRGRLVGVFHPLTGR